MTSQGVLKHALTEGDKVKYLWSSHTLLFNQLSQLIIARMSPLKDQGGYAVANNYGESPHSNLVCNS